MTTSRRTKGRVVCAWWPARRPGCRWSGTGRGQARAAAPSGAPSSGVARGSGGPGGPGGSRRGFGERVEVEGESDGREGASEASHQVVVAAARADGGPCSRDEDLEMDPRVVIEPPHLAEIVHDVPPLVVGQRGIDGVEAGDALVRVRY